MRVKHLDDLPDSSRMWVFGADRELTDDQRDRFLEKVDAFLDEWAAHGTPLKGGREWLHERFLVVAVDEDAAPPSGCSIDALVRVLKETTDETGVSFLGNEAVWYRGGAGEGVDRATRAEFRELARSGTVRPDVVVYDNSITRLGEFRKGHWEGPARDRWHGPAFFGELLST